MSTALRLRAKLPDARVNALANDELGAGLRRNPDEVLFLLVMVEPVAVTESWETGDDVVLLGIETVELLDPEAGRRLYAELYEARTGVAELPFDVELVRGHLDAAGVKIAAATAAGIDTTTGELVGKKAGRK